MEDYNKVINLKQKGLSQNKISSIINVSSATVWHWCNTNRKPRAIYAKKLEKKLPESSKRLSLSLAYIYGVLIGDGSIERNKKNCRVVLNVTDKEFADRFENEIRKWSKMTPARTERNVKYNNKTKYGNVIKGKSHFYVVRLASKQAVEFLSNRIKCGTYDWEVPNEIINASDERIICFFLKGVYDSDGYVIHSDTIRMIGLEMWGKKGLEKIRILLNKIGIESEITQSKKQKIKNTYLLRISRRNNLELFSKKINFTIERKKKILLYSLKSYKRYIFNKVEAEKLILEYLKNNKKTTYEIAKTIKRSYSATCYHLKRLKKKGKLKMIKNWRVVNGNASNIWYVK